MPVWHIIEGQEGCAFAVAHHCVAVVVDALRASATAAMLLDAGARELLVVRTVEEAFTAKHQDPDALLFGERDGLPPPGFDYGNSPREVAAARDRRIVFATTTGAGRLVACWGAPLILMASTVNASAAAKAASGSGRDVVLIPAGLATDPKFDAQEDWAAATAIAIESGQPVSEGKERFAHWRARIESQGLSRLFATAPHAERLRRVGLEADISYCAQRDLTAVVPKAIERVPLGVRCAAC